MLSSYLQYGPLPTTLPETPLGTDDGLTLEQVHQTDPRAEWARRKLRAEV